MSIDEAEEIQSFYKNKDVTRDRQTFLRRMEKKHFRRERFSI